MSRQPIHTWCFVLVVVRDRDKFLVVHERKHGQSWYLPAGRVEPGETFVAAAERETLEESGVKVHVDRLIRIEHTPLPEGAARLRIILTAVPDGEAGLKQRPDGESLAAAWVTLGELDALHLRSHEVSELFAYVANGGATYPLSILSREGAPYGDTRTDVRGTTDGAEHVDREQLIRLYGPAHINLYAHESCAAALEQQVVQKGDVVDPELTASIPSQLLIGRFNDITHCDRCGELFREGDPPYVKLTVMAPDEHRLWQKVRREGEPNES